MDVPHPPQTRRLRSRLAVGIAVVAALVTSACAAGQIAQTANVKPSLDGVDRTFGHIAIRGLSIDAPTGPSYQPGSTAGISVVLVNTGHQADALTGISTSAASGWGWTASSGGSGGTQRVPLPAGQHVAIGQSGEGKLTLKQTKGTIFPGTMVRLTLTFAKAGTTTIPVPVHLSASATPLVIPSQPGEGAND